MLVIILYMYEKQKENEVAAPWKCTTKAGSVVQVEFKSKSHQKKKKEVYQLIALGHIFSIGNL
jgi:hypothetical protein